MGSFGRSAVEGGLLFVALVLLWKAIFLLEPCVGRLNAQPDFDGGDLVWCARSILDRLSVPDPPVLSHYLSLAVLALLLVGLWHGVVAVWRWWRVSRARQWIAERSGRVVFVLRYVLVLAVCAAVDWLVPTVQPCISDFFYSPASGFECQFFQHRLPPVPLSLDPGGTPLPVAAFFIVLIWYAYDARRAART